MGHVGVDVLADLGVAHLAPRNRQDVVMAVCRVVLDLGEGLEKVFAGLCHLVSPVLMKTTIHE